LNVLGIDTATPSSSVALLRAHGQLSERRDTPAAGSRGEHSERVLLLAAELLDQAGLDWAELDLIGVGIGPGGYTGLRIGIATARGLARAHGAALTGIGTLRALAEPVAGGAALALLDARRGELFAAAYENDVELLAPCVIGPSELAATIGELGCVALRAVGDGALARRRELASLAVDVPQDGSPLHRVSAAAICRLAVRDPGRAVEPLYLRRPDAELALGQ